MIAVCLIILILTGLLVAALVNIKKSMFTHNVMSTMSCPDIFIIIIATSCRASREEKLETDVNVAYGTQKEVLALTNTKTV